MYKVEAHCIEDKGVWAMEQWLLMPLINGEQYRPIVKGTYVIQKRQ
jgi:hypothetical protein